MPKEYTECVKYYKKEGMSEKAAKARCAAMFYKRHGMTVNEWVEKHGHGEAADYDYDMMESILEGGEPLEYPEDISLQTNKSGDGMPDKIKANMISSTVEELEGEEDIFELIATKVGAQAYTADGRALVWSKEGIKNSASTWTGKGISINHRTANDYGKILYSWMDDAYSVHHIIKPSEELLPWIRDNKDKMDVSIEATLSELDEENMLIKNAIGSGLTVIFPPDSGACSVEDGCGIMAGREENEDTNTDVEGEEPSADEESAQEEIDSNDTKSDTMTEEKIEAIKAENEDLRSDLEVTKEKLAELKKFKEEVLEKKRDRLMNELASHDLKASEYEGENIGTLEKILATANDLKEKWENEEIEDSGIEIGASKDTSPEDERTEEEIEADEVFEEIGTKYPIFAKGD